MLSSPDGKSMESFLSLRQMSKERPRVPPRRSVPTLSSIGRHRWPSWVTAQSCHTASRQTHVPSPGAPRTTPHPGPRGSLGLVTRCSGSQGAGKCFTDDFQVAIKDATGEIVCTAHVCGSRHCRAACAGEGDPHALALAGAPGRHGKLGKSQGSEASSEHSHAQGASPFSKLPLQALSSAVVFHSSVHS